MKDFPDLFRGCGLFVQIFMSTGVGLSSEVVL
jgi:hypothetical protein